MTAAREPDVYRLVDKDGNLIKGTGKFVKRFYETLKGARHALPYVPSGTRIQAGRVTWEEVP